MNVEGQTPCYKLVHLRGTYSNFEQGPPKLKEKVEKAYKENFFNKHDNDTWEPPGQGYGKGKFVQDDKVGTLCFLHGNGSETIFEEETDLISKLKKGRGGNWK
jgi:hypothetical protein